MPPRGVGTRRWRQWGADEIGDLVECKPNLVTASRVEQICDPSPSPAGHARRGRRPHLRAGAARVELPLLALSQTLRRYRDFGSRLTQAIRQTKSEIIGAGMYLKAVPVEITESAAES